MSRQTSGAQKRLEKRKQALIESGNNPKQLKLSFTLASSPTEDAIINLNGDNLNAHAYSHDTNVAYVTTIIYNVCKKMPSLV